MKNPHAVALGKLGGAATTPAKVAAARANGRKGGRPKAKDKQPRKRRLTVTKEKRSLGLTVTVRVTRPTDPESA